jgi:repressor of nif and glnA expression
VNELQETAEKIMSGMAIMRRDERLLPAVFVKELLRDFGFGQMIQRAGVEYMLRKMDEFNYLKEK